MIWTTPKRPIKRLYKVVKVDVGCCIVQQRTCFGYWRTLRIFNSVTPSVSKQMARHYIWFLILTERIDRQLDHKVVGLWQLGALKSSLQTVVNSIKDPNYRIGG